MKSITLIVYFLYLLSFTQSGFSDEITDLLTENKASKALSDNKVIAVNHTKKNDRDIEKRLQKIYSELDDLKTLKVTVSNGIATLTGEVGSNTSEQQALQFATQTEDVIKVENNIEVSHDLKKRLQKIINKLTQLGEKGLTSLPLLLLALFVFWLFWLMGRWVSNKQTLYRHITVNLFIADLLGKLTHLIFIIIGTVLALSLLEATALLGTILGAAGIFGLAIGFAVRDTVENFIASLLLSIRNPFEVNDVVLIDSYQGHVVRLTSRATILLSFDGNHIRIPNATVYKAIITNFSRQPERRFEFDLGVATDQNLSQAQGLALETLKTISGILSEPKSQALIYQLGNSNVVMRIYGWVNQNTHSFLKVRSEAIKVVKEAFDAANIGLPDPTYQLKIIDSKDASASKDNTDSNQRLESNKRYIQANEINDTKVDLSLEKQIKKENIEKGAENLLNPDAPDEL